MQNEPGGCLEKQKYGQQGFGVFCEDFSTIDAARVCNSQLWRSPMLQHARSQLPRTAPANRKAHTHSFAAALFPLYRPVKVVAASTLRVFTGQAFRRAPIRLDYGRCVQRAQRRTSRHARSSIISQQQTHMSYITEFEAELVKKLQSAEDPANPSSDGFRRRSSRATGTASKPARRASRSSGTEKAAGGAGFPTRPGSHRLRLSAIISQHGIRAKGRGSD